MSTATATQSPNATPLRRAKYVTVEELVLSQYDVDRKRLNDELAKLRTPPEESADIVAGGDKTHPNARDTSIQNDLHSGSLRSPLLAKNHQSRLQPPRDGFNLCL
jgi:hypothetical protein